MQTRVLAIDYGKARIGIAISNTTHTLAQALQVIQNKDAAYVLTTLSALVHEHAVATVVIGNPLDQHGNPTQMSDIIKEFAKALMHVLQEDGLSISCVFWNETMTSYEAYDNLLEKGKHHKDIKALVDMEAARIILQEYLDNKEGK